MISATVANFMELSKILEWGRPFFEASNYAPCGFNSVIARRTVAGAMTNPDQIVIVAKRKKDICGLLIGDIGALPFSAGLHATDLVFIADAGGDLLLARFIAWARQRKVARIDMGHSQTDSVPATRLYEMAGLKATGRMFYLNMPKGEASCPR